MSKQRPTPEQVVEQLRAVRSQIEDDLSPMTPDQRRDLRDRTKHTRETIVAAISAIGMSERVAGTIGRSAGDVRALIGLTDRWTQVEGDLRGLLNGVSSANLMRRYQLALIADHAFAVTKQLIKWPENADLIPIFEEMKRLRNLERRTKKQKSEDAAAAFEGAAGES